MIAISKRTHRYGERVPWYWGLAYHDYETYTQILYLLPLNWVVGLSRRMYFWIRSGPRQQKDESIRSEAWRHGWDAAKTSDWDFPK